MLEEELGPFPRTFKKALGVSTLDVIEQHDLYLYGSPKRGLLL